MDRLLVINTALAFPAVIIPCLLLFFAYYRRSSQPLAGTTEWITRIMNKPRFDFMMTRFPLERRDILPLIAISAVFTFLAFFRLGDFNSPRNHFLFTQERNQIVIELDTAEEIGSVKYFTGLWTGAYTLEFSPDGVNWQEQYAKEEDTNAMPQKYSDLFKWRNAEINEDNLPAKFIRITASKTPLQLGELALYDSAGRLITRSRLTAPDAPELFDEQALIPVRQTYYNSMYFDEIYHGRTALEHLLTIRADDSLPCEMQAVYPYETTHPPLGKLIIAFGIYLFGMVPFGWRFMGALFGAAMLPVLYIFLKNMFGKTPIAVCGTLLFGFDFMRFVQSRIATIDTYGVIFILLSYFFMYRFITMPVDKPFNRHFLQLALSGLFFGIGCASKWIVIYAGAGLALLWLIRLIALYIYYRDKGLSGFARYTLRIVMSSLLFFVAVPVVIYCLSYIPYGLARGLTPGGGMLWDGAFYKIIWENQKSMLSYHGDLIAEHAYSSRWWQWITDARPILFSRVYAGNLKSAIASFGNPIVWWGGFLAIIAMAIRCIKYKDSRALFIIIGYLSQFLPWLFVSRVIFIYHYYAAALFMVIALAHVFNTLTERGYGRYKHAVYGFTSAAGVVFAMFIPALTGIFVPQWYFTYLLRWIPNAWPL